MNRRKTIAALLLCSLGLVCCPLTGHKAYAGIQYAITDLGTLGGTYQYSVGAAVNASGHVTGPSYAMPNVEHTFVWTPTVSTGSSGTMTDLGAPIGSVSSTGTAINDSGQ